jgi:hypothetical protein
MDKFPNSKSRNISDKIAKLAERLANWLDKIDFDATMDGINNLLMVV